MTMAGGGSRSHGGIGRRVCREPGSCGCKAQRPRRRGGTTVEFLDGCQPRARVGKVAEGERCEQRIGGG
jgi:hypothetical protein